MHTVKLLTTITQHPVISVLVGIVVLYVVVFSPRLRGIADESITPPGIQTVLGRNLIQATADDASALITVNDVFLNTLQLDDWIKTKLATNPEYAAHLDFKQYEVVLHVVDGYRLYFYADDTVIVQNIYASDRYSQAACYAAPYGITKELYTMVQDNAE